MSMPQTSRRRDPIPFDDPLAEHLAWLMDSFIGIGPFTFGLDALIGLIPGFGDVLTALVSVVIVGRALQNGVHRAAILRMLVNIAIDTIVGSIPIVGDLFDFAYKSNIKNMKIYRESMSGTREPARDWAFIAIVALVLFLIIAIPIVALVLILQWIISSLPR